MASSHLAVEPASGPVAGTDAFPFAPVRVPEEFASSMQAVQRATADLLALPFDAVRFQYGAAVELGWVERSMLAGRDFELALRFLERFTLGALVREV
jgi:hypothetical protein